MRLPGVEDERRTRAACDVELLGDRDEAVGSGSLKEETHSLGLRGGREVLRGVGEGGRGMCTGSTGVVEGDSDPVNAGCWEFG
jgi:hypothetical protein